jgi:beta-glucosidase
LKRAVEEGIPVFGYTVWSVMDNFEWASGYDQRFGLIYVDFTTQQRILKDSAHWYADVIKTNGASLSYQRKLEEEPCISQ